MMESPQERQRFIKVAGARNESEALLIQDLLREEGVPSMLRRSPGSDVPFFLAAGPRDVLVRASQADLARDALSHPEAGPSVSHQTHTVTASHRRLTNLLVAVAVLVILVWCTTELFV